MARDHVVKGVLEDREVHVAGHARRADDHEPRAERAAVIALVQGDEPFLGERQRVPSRFPVQQGFRHSAIPLPVTAAARWVLAAAVMSLLRQVGRQASKPAGAVWFGFELKNRFAHSITNPGSSSGM